MEPGPFPPGGPELTRTIWHPSPNFGTRRNGARPSMVVIHYTAMENAKAALDRLCDPGPEVSAHYLIGSDGTCWQLIREDMRAWHAGAGQWGNITDVNSHSIGIELDNRGTHPFAEPQMAVLERLLRGILDRWQIPPERVIGHSDMAPTRKQDPGPRFDWHRLARQGLSIWPEPAQQQTQQNFWTPERLAEFGKALRSFGYAFEGNMPPNVLLDAFRQRFGPRSPENTRAAAKDLARRFPVDPGPATA